MNIFMAILARIHKLSCNTRHIMVMNRGSMHRNYNLLYYNRICCCDTKRIQFKKKMIHNSIQLSSVRWRHTTITMFQLFACACLSANWKYTFALICCTNCTTFLHFRSQHENKHFRNFLNILNFFVAACKCASN